MTRPEKSGKPPHGGASLTFEVCKRPGKRPDGRRTAAGPLVTIGRSAGCSIRFDDIPIVSEIHAQIEVRGPTPTVVDCGSHNGTYVNGTLLEAPKPLALHDEIGLGSRGPRLRLVAIQESFESHSGEAGGEWPDPEPSRTMVDGSPATVAAEAAALAGWAEPARRGEKPLNQPRRRARRIAAAAAAAVTLAGLLLLLPMYVGWRGLVRRLEPSIASIVMDRRGEVFPEFSLSWSGSGFLVDRHGRLATTMHLVDLADAVSVRFGDARNSIESKGTVFASRPLDLAVIEVDPAAVKGLRPIRLASAAPSPDEEVIVVGSPGGARLDWARGTVEKVDTLRGVKGSLGSDEFKPRDSSAMQADIEKLLTELRGIRAEYEKRGEAVRQDFLDELVTIDGGIKLTRRDLVRALESDLLEQRRSAATSGPGSMADDTDVLVLAADIAPGNGGWPVVDWSGEAVGVNAGGFQRKDGDRPFRFAIGVRQLVAGLPPAGAAVTAFGGNAR